jgi:ribosomal protein L4
MTKTRKNEILAQIKTFRDALNKSNSKEHRKALAAVLSAEARVNALTVEVNSQLQEQVQ